MRTARRARCADQVEAALRLFSKFLPSPLKTAWNRNSEVPFIVKKDILQHLTAAARERILIIDGSMGVFLQSYNLPEEDFRGERFRNHHRDLKGNYDVLCLTRPDIIEDIHRKYLDAGADIIETNTFNATAISQADFDMPMGVCYDINKAAAEIACRAIANHQLLHHSITPSPKFVAGALGPLNKTLSLSPDVNDPGFRTITFDEAKNAYAEQVRGLVDGGADIILVETIFDVLNCKSAIYAIEEVFEEKGFRLPVIISGTITDASGRTLSGQTVEAFWISIKHAKPFAVGLNCALGAEEMRPHIETLSGIADCFISAYPNAGLPNEFGEYDQTAHEMCVFMEDFARSGFVNIVGGCCGTTPEHIRHIAEHVKKYPPRVAPPPRVGAGGGLHPTRRPRTAHHSPRNKLREHRRAHERDGFDQICQTHQGGKLPRSPHRGPPASGRRRAGH